MKVDIIGRHPVLHPGFCGVMSLYEAKHLSELGHDVQIIIPYKNATERNGILKHRGFKNEQELLDKRDNFRIKSVLLDEEVSVRETDVVIWQSISPDDWNSLYKKCRSKSKIITKNFPKTVAFQPRPFSKGVEQQFSAFDLISFALKEDYQAVWGYRDFALQNQHKFIYSQRGADPIILHDREKAKTPVLAVDTPNTRDHVGIEHLFQPIRRLKEKYPELQVLSLGGTQLPFDFAKALRYMPYNSMYRDFLNPAWIYCVVDYSQSPEHIKGHIHSIDRSWDSKAIYEVQTIEAQMAGAIIAGYRKNIIPELIDEKISAIWDNFASPDEITASLEHAIEHQKEISRKVRNRAFNKFRWEEAIKSWEFAMMNLVDNNYDRDRKAFCLPSALEGIRAITHGPNTLRAASTPAALKPGEKVLLFELADKSRRVVEFGCGGSTKIMAKSRVDHIDSFETDMDWIAKLMDDSELTCDIQSGRIRMHHIDIGPTKEWGYPIKEDPLVCARYAKAPWSLFPLHEVDLVLVDGRYRVVTALEAALRSEPHCLIAVDDYQDRPHYEALEEVLDTMISAERMVVFGKGEKWNRNRAFDLAEKYRFDPR